MRVLIKNMVTYHSLASAVFLYTISNVVVSADESVGSPVLSIVGYERQSAVVGDDLDYYVVPEGSDINVRLVTHQSSYFVLKQSYYKTY